MTPSALPTHTGQSVVAHTATTLAAAAPASGMAPDAMLNLFLSPLGELLANGENSEICVNRPGEAWTEDARGWMRHVIPQLTLAHCRSLATLIASFNARTVDHTSPVLEAALPQGYRVQIVLPPACEPDTVSFTIRRGHAALLTLDDLDALGTFERYLDTCGPRCEQPVPDQSAGVAAYLADAVRTRRNILVVGPTGSGKTTLARALCQRIPPDERLVTIEDVHELALPAHPNHVHLFYQQGPQAPSNLSSRAALMCALRMRPDRILLAELRGDEAWDYVKATNTGHPGAICTMHANSARDALDQLLALVKDSARGAGLDLEFVRARLRATIDLVVYMERRKVREVLDVRRQSTTVA